MTSYVKSSEFWLPLGVSLLVTPFCLLIAIASAGAGHGSDALAKVLYPFTLLSTIMFGSITTPFLLLAAIQFIIYGLVFGLANVNGRFVPLVFLAIGLHIGGVIACFVLIGRNFS